jgi:para-aminobenzoate synthetase component 1
MSHLNTQTTETRTCTLHTRSIPWPLPIACLNECFGSLPLPCILGGNHARIQGGGFSYWAAEPRETFEFRAHQQAPFDNLKTVLNKYHLAQTPSSCLPSGLFPGGWMGFFSYDLGRFIESLPVTAVDDLQMPLIRLCFYDRLVAFDHKQRLLWLLALTWDGDHVSPEEKLQGLVCLIEEARSLAVPTPCSMDMEHMDHTGIQVNMTKQQYLDRFHCIKRYIIDGDTYQVNFSLRFADAFNKRALDVFHWQNVYNPCAYAAFIQWSDVSIISASPELFLNIQDGCILTRPIKGTRPRLAPADPRSQEINKQYYQDLLHSHKEQAELNMIIDLERNDLARICIPGTRRVMQSRTIDTLPTVFHAVATIGGRLQPDIDLCDVLKATFPGGSITGAPKIRSMQIIDELEPTARNIYTGSIGYIGVDQSVCLNIAIRTIIISQQTAFAQAGGGIVADSDPEAEYQEAYTKARALLAGIRSVQKTAR